MICQSFFSFLWSLSRFTQHPASLIWGDLAATSAAIW